MMIPRMVHFRSLLILAFLFFATTASSSAQEKSRRTIAGTSVKDVARSRTPQSQNKNAQIYFDYHTSPLGFDFKESEFASVTIAGDGTTQAVRYGPYNPAIIGVYEGKLPEILVRRLVAQAEEIIPKASEITKPFIGSCDGANFGLTIDYQRPSGVENKRAPYVCLWPMPQEIREYVEEMRGLWKQLDESPLAYGYVRSFRLEGEFLKAASANQKDFISIRKLPPRAQLIVRNVRKQTPKFYALNQIDYQLFRVSTGDSFRFYMRDGSNVYFFTDFLLSRPRKLFPKLEDLSREAVKVKEGQQQGSRNTEN